MLFLCLKIFFVRILDVSLGTMRTVMTVKGKSLIASLIGFVEVTIWFLVVKEAINTDSNAFWIVLSYSGGYAIGTYIGGKLADKLISGTVGVQAILSNQNDEVIKIIREHGYAVSVMDVKGQDNQKYMLYIEINKKRLQHLQQLIKELDEKAFVVVNETKYVMNGYIK